MLYRIALAVSEKGYIDALNKMAKKGLIKSAKAWYSNDIKS